MRTITSSTGTVEPVIIRRTESSDAQEITKLISPASVAVFGRVNVIYVLEKANLAVTLSTVKKQVLAHAAFLDYPIGDPMEQMSWQQLLRTYFNGTTFTPLNTLFLHLFVAQTSFSTASAKEIMRTVFNAITELEYICLVTPYSSCLESALMGVFEPMPCVKEGVQCAVFVCHRHHHCPRLHVRKARVEDYDDLTHVLAERGVALEASRGPYFLAELIQAQDETNHVAVCENEGRVVGLISISGDVDLKLLARCFELGPFDGLRKASPAGPPQRPGPSELGQIPQEPHTTSQSISQSQAEITEVLESPESDGSKEASESNENISRARCDTSEAGSSGACGKEFTDSSAGSQPEEPPNAFCVQLFVIDKRLEMRSVDFLPYAFKVFPERDFCVLSVPQLHAQIPLLQVFNRAVPRPSCSLNQQLYLLHRSGLIKTLEVAAGLSDDTAAVQGLVQNLHLHHTLLEDLDRFLRPVETQTGRLFTALVAEVEEQIVGVIIIRNEKDVEYIRANYNIEHFVYFSHHQREEHGRLCHYVLNPVFQRYTRHVLKEALRLAHKTCLYFAVYPPYHTRTRWNARAGPLAAALDCMVPVCPRRRVVYPLESWPPTHRPTQITEEQEPFALNHINRKLTMEPRLEVSARIVVVGASDVGLAFLEALVFCPHLRFTNLTLVSTHGLPDAHGRGGVGFLATSHAYNERDLAQISLRSWVSGVTGKMTAIDRAAKHIQVTGGHVVPYDHLVLCTGQQYQMVCPTGIDISVSTSSGQVPDQPRRRYTGPVPSNLFTLNDPQDCSQAQHWLCKNFLDQEGNAVVYGDSVDVYTCVETLLCLGVRASRVHLVHQATDEPPTCFPDPALQQVVRRALRDKEVHLHHNCLLAQLNDGQDPEPITSVSFTTDGPPLRLECTVFFNFAYKSVDYDAFKAISEASLVFDGRLVIDAAFHTNDRSIFAAGPLTKFSRRYHAEGWTHANFSSREVGQDLASALLPFFDPDPEPPTNRPPDRDRLITLYRQPKVQGGRLPGGCSYLHIQRPSPCSDRPLSGATPGRKIQTGRVETRDYICLQFSQHGLVETVTCLSPEPLPVSNYVCLYGKHQLLLNHLYQRFDEGLLSDLHSYFRESWCMAVYHDRFADFEQEVRLIMDSTKVEADGDVVTVSKLSEMIVNDEWEEPGLYLSQVFGQSEGPAKIKRSAVDFLKYNRHDLTMYVLPGTL
ncbi:LOW QUALITY PROTEIN: cilia- and flagella-associated protein 61 [Brachyhypopomus gauderio]|uniref:LOW QUALITY PROTEIN: cilia- and flagella-associated protein 61 n=1 Tax=Brachyhypopomus gauderio TaxID=698409 RepID=UPI004041A1E1